MPAFSRLILALACLTAVGTLYESHTGYNVFYSWSAQLLSPIATVAQSPTILHPVKIVVGPTHHGLALASMLTIGLPFAVLPLLEARRPSERLRYLLIIGLILAADLTTDRKTAIYAPLAAFIVLTAYKRQLLRGVPIALIVLIPLIHFASPGALGGVRQIIPSSSNGDYTDGRAGDYAAVAPDILNNVDHWAGLWHIGCLELADVPDTRQPVSRHPLRSRRRRIGGVPRDCVLRDLDRAWRDQARRRASTAGARGRSGLCGIRARERDLRCRRISAGCVLILVRCWTDRSISKQAVWVAAGAGGRSSHEHRRQAGAVAASPRRSVQTGRHVDRSKPACI